MAVPSARTLPERLLRGVRVASIGDFGNHCWQPAGFSNRLGVMRHARPSGRNELANMASPQDWLKLLISARISSTRHTVVFGPSLTGFGYFPVRTPFSHVDFEIGRRPLVAHRGFLTLNLAFSIALASPRTLASSNARYVAADCSGVISGRQTIS